ncbi:3-oxoacyl-[acyl-carrier-protein] synthase III C-terminal domain-containing protein [Streptomyces sp. Li-HN-5-11]|uniref:3-oxoacyl-[acyl-carrier-protein] synthase III C-terminal domain-containing protein n=1 Tax=Streptomyces sp. Li-HN-5-11 TaxID=3075432 RepID=UPI0028B11E52|nr:3-oxoacyl-[acyl-carrier-protein] synthase III C-terminal domain-containing protein [Streptomyces sp. Li-HN-5-11]WNM31299.1 3-oxoacyl-[acyl-carrier-protein] synthase III C-terminal domain-containing protein [Streptomyces sp. Li-HN-5-11]
MPVVSAPVIALPRHQVSTDEVLDVLGELYPEHPRLAAVQAAIRSTTVRSRWFTRPPGELFTDASPVLDRTRAHLRDSLELAEKAARQALFEAGLTPGDVDGLVVTSSTGHTMPGLDIALIEKLGLPCSVHRVPVTQLGCAGGAFALVCAMSLVALRPRARILVVCADVFSHYLHRADTGMDGMIFKGLIGDAAGACVVRADGAGPRMELGDSWQCVLPGSRTIVGTYVDGSGLHTHNSPELCGVVRQAVERVAEWLRDSGAVGEKAPRFLVSHSGSPKILDSVVASLGCAPELVTSARDSLRDVGNVGSVSVLDVLERTFAKQPGEGDRGLLLAVGPGVSIIAVKTVWHTGG